MNVLEVLANVFGGLTFTWANAVMLLIGATLIYLAVAKEYEPVLLLPIGFGCVLANLGMSAYAEESFMRVIYEAGIEDRAFPSAHLHRCRRNDRFPSVAGATETRITRRGGRICNLWAVSPFFQPG